MPTVVGVTFERYGRIHYFSLNRRRNPPQVGDVIVVETDRGLEFGQVEFGPTERDPDSLPEPPRQFRRLMSERDERRREAAARKREDVIAACRSRIPELGLEMKLVDAEVSLDGRHITVFFSAEQRVDFRELVKQLAGQFHARIQMQQIGVRDEAKRLGGCGVCGRALCCATWMDKFDPVGIRMAKEQRLSLNPSKISGVCGRLMCCLRYEYEHYRRQNKRMPKIGARIDTVVGQGAVRAVNPLSEEVTIETDSGEVYDFRPPCARNCPRWENVIRRRRSALDVRGAHGANGNAEEHVAMPPEPDEPPAAASETGRAPRRRRRGKKTDTGAPRYNMEPPRACAEPAPEKDATTDDAASEGGGGGSASSRRRRRRRRRRQKN